ncbi:hypothetical protein MJ561_18560 [Klebsiella pneumoniae]|nr:hypothetical protein MJ561_18560 [Klebsiella pneumoniae]
MLPLPVETLEQENHLRSHGVDVPAGFYYARPMLGGGVPGGAQQEERRRE